MVVGLSWVDGLVNLLFSVAIAQEDVKEFFFQTVRTAENLDPVNQGKPVHILLIPQLWLIAPKPSPSSDPAQTINFLTPTLQP